MKNLLASALAAAFLAGCAFPVLDTSLDGSKKGMRPDRATGTNLQRERDPLAEGLKGMERGDVERLQRGGYRQPGAN